VTTWQVAELLNFAYGKAASVHNAVSGLKNTGLWPLDRSIFQDHDFQAASSTDQEKLPDPQVGHSEKQVEPPVEPNQPHQATTQQSSHVRPVDVSPLPQKTAAPSSSPPKPLKKRKTSVASVLTSSPYKAELERASKSNQTTKKREPQKKTERKKKRKIDAADGGQNEKEREKKHQKLEIEYKVGQYVIFTYEDELFPGQITGAVSNGTFTIKSMQRSGKNWKWPKVEDVMDYEVHDIKQRIKPPKILKRNIMFVAELKDRWD
jgi:hypothetical protein